jgi:hypothetical protein
MAWIVVRSLLWGLAGLVAAPVVTFFGVLVLAYSVDSGCGTPGDSGGCEMGAAGLAIASALPGFVIIFMIALTLGLRRRIAASGK